MAKVGYSVSDKMTIEFFGNYDQIKNDYDGGFDNTGTSDTNLNKTRSKQFRFGFSPKFKYDKGEFVLNSSFNKLVRSYDELDTYSNSVSSSLRSFIRMCCSLLPLSIMVVQAVLG